MTGKARCPGSRGHGSNVEPSGSPGQEASIACCGRPAALGLGESSTDSPAAPGVPGEPPPCRNYPARRRQAHGEMGQGRRRSPRGSACSTSPCWWGEQPAPSICWGCCCSRAQGSALAMQGCAFILIR